MKETIASTKQTARIAGLLYLIMGLTGAYGMMYVPLKLELNRDIISVANNIVAHEFLFRSGIFILLVSAITSVFCVLVFYRLLSHIDKHQARLMVAFVIIQVPIFFVLETFSVMSLVILNGKVFASIPREQQYELNRIFVSINQNGLLLLEVFWGLWLFPLGFLIYKSTIIPRVLGILLIMVGVGYTIDSLIPVLFPSLKALTQPFAYTVAGVGELSIILWLLIKGVKDKEESIK